MRIVHTFAAENRKEQQFKSKVMDEILKKLVGETFREMMPDFADEVAKRLTPKCSENVLKKDACKRLNITEPTLRKLIAQKEIRTVKIGSKEMIPTLEIDRLLEGGNYKYNRN